MTESPHPSKVAGQPWTEREIQVVVAEYFDMLDLHRQGITFVKAERGRAIEPSIPARSRSSTARKYGNISACLAEMGRPWLPGYAPLPNSQEALRQAVRRSCSGE